MRVDITLEDGAQPTLGLTSMRHFDISMVMEIKVAVTALSALAQEHRLEIFRKLVHEGPEGMTAGAIARWLGVAPSSLSFHLGHLERAGLLTSRRVARHVHYAVDIEGTRQLIGFLTEECCEGRPEICGYPVGPAGSAPSRRPERPEG